MAVPKNDKVEFVFGLAGPVGTDFDVVASALRDALESIEYSSEVVRMSAFLKEYKLAQGLLPVELSAKYEDDRIRSYQDAGNALREAVHDNAALAIRAIRYISESRLQNAGPEATPSTVPPRRHAYILNSLKRPEEVDQFRAIYDGGFFLIAVVAPKTLRVANLAKLVAKSHQTTNEKAYRQVARELVERDESDASLYGQRLTDTFPTADLFVSFGTGTPDAEQALVGHIKRFVRLIMGANDITPSADEVAMFHAHGAALRSGSLARQVGAAITNRHHDLLSVGCNDVPTAGGGIYWDNEHYDHRDIKKERDASNAHEEEIVRELLHEFEPWCSELPSVEAAMDDLSNSRVMNLLEFNRSLHAEMEAILAAARNGTAIRGALLFTTTFPCHECAKLIVGAGIAEVRYIEPYPKNRVAQMFQHEIATEPYTTICRSCGTTSTEEKKCPECGSAGLLKVNENGICNECEKVHRIPFRPFVGVGPRRFAELFSMITAQGAKFKRKDSRGYRLPWSPAQRRPMLALSYIEKESLLINEYRDAFDRLKKKETAP